MELYLHSPNTSSPYYFADTEESHEEYVRRVDKRADIRNLYFSTRTLRCYRHTKMFDLRSWKNIIIWLLVLFDTL
jgi:hypothetical protein